MKPGSRNLITDVSGIAVGNYEDSAIRSGVTAVICDPPSIASVHVMGGAPGTRETDLLAPENTVEGVSGVVLSGGSAFGLDSAGGVQAALREAGKGFQLHSHVIPLVPAAVIFDLPNGGDKDWGLHSPYRDFGYEAARAAGEAFAIGSAGGGFGALTAGLKGGLGSASAVLDNGFAIGAVVAVNPVGAVTIGDLPNFWAAPFEMEGEFGDLGLPAEMPPDATDIRIKFGDRARAGGNTAIGVVATDAVLDKAQAKRLAMSAHDGIARAIWPSHTPFDGDTIFSLATGAAGRKPEGREWIDLHAHAATVVARAIARGVYHAAPMEGDIYPAWRQRFAG